jgi:hypothetical protein
MYRCMLFVNNRSFIQIVVFWVVTLHIPVGRYVLPPSSRLNTFNAEDGGSKICLQYYTVSQPGDDNLIIHHYTYVIVLIWGGESK